MDGAIVLFHAKALSVHFYYLVIAAHSTDMDDPRVDYIGSALFRLSEYTAIRINKSKLRVSGVQVRLGVKFSVIRIESRAKSRNFQSVITAVSQVIQIIVNVFQKSEFPLSIPEYILHYNTTTLFCITQ